MRSNPIDRNRLVSQTKTIPAAPGPSSSTRARLVFAAVLAGLILFYCSAHSVASFFVPPSDSAHPYNSRLLKFASATVKEWWSSRAGSTALLDKMLPFGNRATPKYLRPTPVAEHGVAGSHGTDANKLGFPSSLTVVNRAKVERFQQQPNDSASGALGAVAPTGFIVPVPEFVLATTYQYSTSVTSTAWLNTANWTGNPGHWPGVTSSANASNGAVDDVATIGSVNFAGSNLGINFTTAAGGFTLGAIEFLSSANKTITIGDSAGTAGTLALTGGSINTTANTILSNEGSQLLTIAPRAGGTADMSLALGNATDNLIQINGGGGITISSIIKDGTGTRLTLGGSGSGALTLSGANTFTGGVTVGTGILQLGADTVSGATITSSAVGTGTLTLGNGSTIRSDGSTARTLRNNLNFGGSVTIGATATQTGAITFDSGGLTTPSMVTLTGDTQLTINTNTTINNAIGGAGRSLSKAGAKFLTLGAANTFSGSYTNTSGSTLLAVNGALGSITTLAINSGAVATSVSELTDAINDNAAVSMSGTADLDLTEGSETIGSLSGTASATIEIGSSAAGFGNFTVGDATSTTFAGVISGDRPASDGPIFTKQGSGTLTLTGANTYTGATLIASNGGTLKLDSAGATTPRLAGTTSITVNGGGTLLLANSSMTASNNRISNGASIILAGGVFNLGGQSEGAAGTNGVGGLTLNATSTIDFGALGTKNLIQFAGVTHTGGTLQILDWEGTPGSANGNDRLLFAGTSSTFQSAFMQSEVSFNGASGYGWMDFGSYYEIFGIAPVPEPATWGSAALAAAAVGYRLLLKRAHRLRVR